MTVTILLVHRIKHFVRCSIQCMAGNLPQTESIDEGWHHLVFDLQFLAVRFYHVGCRFTCP
jgi:hypothetical protein